MIDAPHHQLLRKTRKAKKKRTTGSCFVRPKQDIDNCVQFSKESTWNGSAGWESDWCLESSRLGSERRWSKRSYPNDVLSKDLSQIYLAPLGTSSEVAQSKEQAISMWETHGLRTTIDKANFRAICKRRLFNYCINRRKFRDGISSRFLNGDVAQMVERSLYMREVPGSVTQNFQLLRGARKSKKELQEAILLDKKKSLICKSNMRKGSLRNSTELAEKGIGVPNRQSLPQKDVEGYISTPLMSESKTCLWHK